MNDGRGRKGEKKAISSLQPYLWTRIYLINLLNFILVRWKWQTLRAPVPLATIKIEKCCRHKNSRNWKLTGNLMLTRNSKFKKFNFILNTYLNKFSIFRINFHWKHVFEHCQWVVNCLNIQTEIIYGNDAAKSICCAWIKCEVISLALTL